MADHRYKEWDLPGGKIDGLNWDHVMVAVLMDIRRELQQIRARAQCPTFARLVAKLDYNTQYRKRRRKNGRRKTANRR